MNKHKELIDSIIAKAKKKNISEIEVYISEGESFSINIFKSEIEKYELADSKGLGVRGFYNGKIGYSYTEKLSDDSIDYIIDEIIQNATINDSEEQDYIYGGSKEYKKTNNYNIEMDKITEEEKIEFAKKMEEVAYKADERVKLVRYCTIGSSKGFTTMANSKGLDLSDSGNFMYSYTYLIANDGNENSVGLDFAIGNDFTKFDYEKIAKTAAQKAIEMLGAKPVKTGNYPIIIDSRVFADMLSVMTSAFSARTVQKGLSRLKGKVGKSIAKSNVTLIEDPFLIGGGSTSSFDGEGVATKYKKVIDKGDLTSYLYNLKTAKIDGVESTGNASRGSFKSTIGTAPTNMYFEKGEKTLEELVAQTPNGLYITELGGMHSGFNNVSGDFSLIASGFKIENDKIGKPIKQITVSGNYFDLLNNVVEFSNDLKFNMSGSLGSASVLIESLSVAGE